MSISDNGDRLLPEKDRRPPPENERTAIRKMGHGPWAWMSKAAQERALTAASSPGLAIYCALCRLESDAPTRAKDGFHASAYNIAHWSGVSSRTVKRYLPFLAKAGLFIMKSGRNAGGTGAHEANVFRLLDVGSPCVTKSQACDFETSEIGTQKRKFSRREKEPSSEEEINRGFAAVSPARAEDGASLRRDKQLLKTCGVEAFKRG